MTAAQMRAKRSIGLAGSIAYLMLVSVCATALAAVVGVLFVIMIALPFSLLGASQWLNGLWNGALWAIPVTAIPLPATVAIGRSHPVILYFALPVVGLIGGLIAMRFWSGAYASALELFQYAKTYLSFDHPPSTEEPGGTLWLMAGALAGLAAGAFFSAAVYEMRR
jgi:hypothetical protein